MAIFIPSLETIEKWRDQPSEGELYMLNFLQQTFLNDDSYEIYYKPFLNEDRPDIVLMRKYHGVLLIEVNEWDLDDYEIEGNYNEYHYVNPQDVVLEGRKWVNKQDNSTVISPLNQISKYYDNIMNYHISILMSMRLKDKDVAAVVSKLFFFYKASRTQNFDSKEFEDYMEPFDFFNQKNTTNKYTKYFCVFSRDDLTCENFRKLLQYNYIGRNFPSKIFTEELYNSFRELLVPPYHIKKDDSKIFYTDKQKQIIYDLKFEGKKLVKKEKETKNALIRGVYGSGKTTVLAATAVETYKKLKKTIDEPRILIICFNITLVNWIEFKLSEVDEDFYPKSFLITNYHHFIKGVYRKLGVPIYPLDNNTEHSDEEMSEYFEKNYFGNIEKIQSHLSCNHIVDDLYKFDAIFIDEAQDYHKIWTRILKDCFLLPNGRFFVFGDEKQNIYDNKLVEKQIDVYFGTREISRYSLNECKRSNYNLQEFLYKYQKSFLSKKYETDEELGVQSHLLFNFDNVDYSIEYHSLSDLKFDEKIRKIFSIVDNFILSHSKDDYRNDITILGDKIYLLRRLDVYFRYKLRLKTLTMFETNEYLFLNWINHFEPENNTYYNNDQDFYFEKNNFNKISNQPSECIGSLEKSFFDGLCRLVLGEKYRPLDKDKKILLSIILTCFDLMISYCDDFIPILNNICYKHCLDANQILGFYNQRRDDFLKIIDNISDEHISSNKIFFTKYRENKKRHFINDINCLKICTVHSFKGWESKTVFMLLDQSAPDNNSFAELVYTGLSRTREKLVIINVGNELYGSVINDLLKI